MGKILLSGYYGFGNTGDEAILASTVNAILKQNPSCKISVLSNSPEETKSLYGVGAFHRMSTKEILKAMKDTDLVAFGGGSLLQDTTSFRSLSYYTGIIYLARLLRKPLMVYANGVGPVRSPLGRILVGKAVNTAAKITVRDKESRSQLRDMGVTKNITVTSDPAFLLERSPKERVDEILKDFGEDEDIVYLALRANKAPQWFYEEMEKAVSYLSRKGYRPCLLVMQKGDEKALEGLDLPRISDLTPQEALGVLARGRFCIGMRLHTLILSAKALTPFLGVDIDPKISSFSKSAGCPFIENPNITPPYSIADALEGFLESKENLRETLAKNLPTFQDLARQNINILLECLVQAVGTPYHDDDIG